MCHCGWCIVGFFVECAEVGKVREGGWVVENGYGGWANGCDDGDGKILIKVCTVDGRSG